MTLNTPDDLVTGDVLRVTLPYGLLIGFALGALALLWTLVVR